MAIAFFIIAQHVVLGTMDTFYHYYGFGFASNMRSAEVVMPPGFAVVINSYKRPDRLQDAVWHYAHTCGPSFGVQQIYVVWSELDKFPPALETLFQPGRPISGTGKLRNDPLSSSSESYDKNGVEVKILKMNENSLNSRFRPIESLKSDVVLMVDDDLRISCPSLYHGFEAWATNPDAMVGYYPRLASQSRTRVPNEYTYHHWPEIFLTQKMNFVLTKASFLHKQYLNTYWDETRHPRQILDYVDKNKNCEDIAMAMLVANYTKSTLGESSKPIYVEGRVTDKGIFGGISTLSGHHMTRSRCLTDLSEMYLSRGWGLPFSYDIPLKEASWLHHSPDMWWQYRPSNPAEWLALLNIFR
eukprot:CAMPEP_0194224790 /NCGR_PEP_ID=MMETSP0156-20130528/38159_1 /TAXON_ID=33649 /ORGANISM="Thalassionema nitzschioides, Strain L26-B" /LENGTH=356 /DNA_ID=CAMNT_0038956493 /DNA_START=349 /DNA_END=1419 /DNA_ORIENTATION=-